MTDKLTDNDIKKALSVLNGGHSCKNCKYDNGKGDDRCGLKGCKIARYALDYINRLEKKFKFAENINHLQMEEVQKLKEKNNVLAYELANSLQDAENKQAEIERLKNEVDGSGCCSCVEHYKAEAYKEFAERLKNEFPKMLNRSESAFSFLIDNLLKEMVGDAK